MTIQSQRAKTASSPNQYTFDETRIIQLHDEPTHGVPISGTKITGVIYWMQRDQRVQDNWAMVYAQKMALEHKVPLMVVFCLQSSFLGATIRAFDFMLRGLEEMEQELLALNIPFKVLFGAPKDVIPPFVIEQQCNLVITDFSPLRVSREWVSELAPKLTEIEVHLTQVDAHNVVPVWVTSDKQEYAARTIRRKIHKKLKQYLVEFPPIIAHSMNDQLMKEHRLTDWKKARNSLKVDMTVGVIDWCQPGTRNGLDVLYEFIHHRLESHHKDRNDPNLDAISNLSPYYHFGQIAPARAALEIQKMTGKYKESVERHLEQLIVRRELADNFCFYNAHYDRVCGAPQWAQDTLKLHEDDEREYLYSLEELEGYQTHDDLWNAAQRQLADDGKMHGILRLYWAKKILEWTESPKRALETAIYLNDRYSIDGRDPNGFVGCIWSVCGVHDRAFKERPIYGKVRYQNYKGCARKFDVKAFVKKMRVHAVAYSPK